MNKIQKGDKVVVLVGKDRGKHGIVEKSVGADFVVVAGVGVAKKAVKPNPAINLVGGIVDKLMPIHVSNVALFNVETGKVDRVGFKVVDGKKVRIFKSNGEVVKAQ